MSDITDNIFAILVIAALIFSICIDIGLIGYALDAFIEGLVIESIILTALFSLLTATLFGVVEYIDKNF